MTTLFDELQEWQSEMILYDFALQEINTKLNILNKEHAISQKRNPIEHIKSRLKRPESIIAKLERKGIESTPDNVRQHLKDIAGVRIICSFIDDIYKIVDMIEQQEDIHVLEVKDYIQRPKANGYRSLHLLIEIPIFLSDRVEQVPVEIQIRTSAMDFWASLEHKIHYKFQNTAKGQELTTELKDIAEVMMSLDSRMFHIKQEVDKDGAN